MYGVKKIEAEFNGVVLGFNLHKRIAYYNEPITTISIRCSSEKLSKSVDIVFNYSSKWQKLNLEKGDYVEFNGIIKTTEWVVHKQGRWVDNWGHLSGEDRDIEIGIEIQSPKQIVKI